MLIFLLTSWILFLLVDVDRYDAVTAPTPSRERYESTILPAADELGLSKLRSSQRLSQCITIRFDFSYFD